MNRRKVTLRVVWGALITLLAALAFAPGLTADAPSFSLLKKAEPALAEVNEQPVVDLAIAPEIEESPQYVPDADESPAAADRQTSPAQDEQSGSGFEHDTALAMIDAGTLGSLSNASDAHIFRSFGSGGLSGGGSNDAPHRARQGHQNHPAGAPGTEGSSSNPQFFGDETSTEGKPANDAKNELPQQDANAGDKKPTDVAFNDYPPTDDKPRVSVPEPSSIVLLLVGIGGLCVMRRLS